MLNIITLNTAVPLPRFLKTLFLSTFLLLYQGTAVQATDNFLDMDVNEDGEVDSNDGLAIYYVLTHTRLLELHPAQRHRYLRYLATEATDEKYVELIERVKALQANDIYDVNGIDEVNSDDGLAMNYVLTHTRLLELHPAQRHRYLRYLVTEATDEKYLELIDRIKAVKKLQAKDIYDVNGEDGVNNDDALLMYYVNKHIEGEGDDDAQRNRYLYLQNHLKIPTELSTVERYKEKLTQITPYLKNLEQTNLERYNEKLGLVDSHYDDIKDYEYKRVIRYVQDLSASTPEAYETAEYNGQKYYQDRLGNGKLSPLDRIKASSMYVRGGTGAGITVGVMDFGASPAHPDLAGKYVSVKGMRNVDPYDGPDIEYGHGTHVTGIIAAKRNDIGMHGVAYDAKIASYKLIGAGATGIFDSQLGANINEMRIGFGEEGEPKEPVLITNNSWKSGDDSLLEKKQNTLNNRGESVPIENEKDKPFVRPASKIAMAFPASLSAYRDYVNAGGVQVWAAGNSSKDQVGWQAGLPFYHSKGPKPDRQQYPDLYKSGYPGLDKLREIPKGTPDFPDLEEGWLAVVAVGHGGEIAGYSNKCGVAAEWCLAAPGGDGSGGVGIYSTVPTELGATVPASTESGATGPVPAESGAVESVSIEADGYGETFGTSSATPLVAGGLAALKSMFPSLTYHQVRQRMLDSANDEGTYAPDAGKALSSTYGHGLLDLDAASRPMNENGGNTGDTTSFAFGSSRSAAVISTSGASLTLPAAAISRYLAGRDILVLDNYQRAPFWFPLTSFARVRRSAYLSLDDLGLAQPQRSWDEQGDIETVAVVGNDYQARSLSNGSWFVGKAEGERVMEGISQLVGTPLPQGNYRMSADAHGVTFGFTTGLGSFYTSAAMNGNAVIPMDSPGFGIVNWSPETILTASFVPNGKAAEAFGISVASQLRRPMGLAGTGALKPSGDSIELAYRRDIVAGESYRFGVSGRFARLRSDASPMIHLDDTLLATTELDFSLRLGVMMTLNARLGMERPVGASSGSMRVASNEENSQLKYNDIRINGADFLSFDKAVLSVYYTRGQHTNFGVGVAALRDGFGETETMVGARAEIRF